MLRRLNSKPFTGVDMNAFTGVNIGANMTKQQAADLFGGVHADLARALDMTRGGISQWPDELTDAQADRVIGAALRLGRQVPDELLRARISSTTN
jgi:transcriptional repressor of cell division inhibition gene dicB